MTIAARADYPVDYQSWVAISATPVDFKLNAGEFGLTLQAGVWGTATLQRVISNGAGGQVAVSVLSIAGDSYSEVTLPAGWYRLALAGITSLTGLIELINHTG